LAQEIRHLRFLVLDEADRMIEAGHFAELENILRLTLLESKYVPSSSYFRHPAFLMHFW
jgi:ATP-dependent RNA helicase DDX24/MAK5